ncbi:MAG: FG-GAP-like repeat-containing protein [Planctomycetaceae bacterium]
MRTKRFWSVAICCLLLAGLAVIFLRPARRGTSDLLRAGKQAAARGEFLRALESADAVLVSEPHSTEALLLAGQTAAQLKRFDLALTYLRRMKPDGSVAAVQAAVLAGDVELNRGHAAAAEESYRAALRQDPRQLQAQRQLAYLLGVEGRCWEAAPFLLAAVKQGEFTLHHLVLLAAAEPVIHDAEFVERCLAAMPDDPVPLIGVARTAIKKNQIAEAKDILQKVISSRVLVNADTAQVEAQARWGELLVELDPARLADWKAHLPSNADEHPEIWVVQGLWAEKQEAMPEAARCFWEAIRRDPNHRVANYHLGSVLSRLHRESAARTFLDRAGLLKDLQLTVDDAFKNPESPAWKHQAAALCESLGRPWEAWGWTSLAVSDNSTMAEREQLAARQSVLTATTPQTWPAHNPALHVDLTDMPLPRLQRGTIDAPQSTPASTVRFAEVAKSMGLSFSYLNGADASNAGVRMFETTGGGVGVIDFDLDGWPDLFLPQGGTWPPQPGQTNHTDRLFRNHQGRRAEDVTLLAGLIDQGYSQGVAVGDFNNDGFPDLYVAHIGRNLLLQNNGDGTFQDITLAAGLDSARWTTSCLIADLNGDSWPDLYDVNYLSGDSIHSTVCRQGNELRACNAKSFAAEQDEVFLSLGDGRFASATESSGIVMPEGRGMGIVAADFDGSGRLSLFIANDAVPNFFFVNRTAQRGGPLHLEEQALVSGLALDADGLAQACMGVAAGDANDDGRLDLFVTNFQDESNTLYLQQSGNLFVDATRSTGLRDPSYPLVGFGTQFLDGELDGRLDLVLTNGHVFDLSYQGRQYQMPPQYFRNLGVPRSGQAQFTELSARTLGDYFQQKYLGRGLARLDWNRDGLEDFAVSNMNAPASLVLNQTTGVGHFLGLQLRGLSCDRDAIGTSVRVTVGSRTFTSQLTAGDGYEVSNQRRLVFGLGAAPAVDRIEIRWPHGRIQELGPTPADQELLIREGAEAVTLPF